MERLSPLCLMFLFQITCGDFLELTVVFYVFIQQEIKVLH